MPRILTIRLKSRKFGRLTVLYKDPSSRRWVCRCSCGAKVIMAASVLISGHVKSCGCLYKEKLTVRVSRRNLTGKIFGRLTVLERASHDKHGAARWKCRCQCGRLKLAVVNSLVNGRIKSCGCLPKELRRLQKIAASAVWQGSAGNYIVIKKDGIRSFQHVMVMEKVLGRKLYPKETVHHKNCIPTDNRRENLELWASSHPAGARVRDLITHAKQILNRYGVDERQFA